MDLNARIGRATVFLIVEKNSYTYKLTEPQQAVLIDILSHGNYLPAHVDHTIIAARTPDCGINLYKSGKCLVQGKGATEFVQFVLEPAVLHQAGVGYESVLDPEAAQPHMGIDESGKGDFFGPLVVAGAYVDEDLAQTMREMGVKDSKNISSDNKALDMGRELRRMLGRRFSVVKIGPQAYNRLYSRMRNVNLILAWAHARAIENLLDAVPGCPRAVSDQFGNESQVRRALMQKGRDIALVQRHRAESDVAVAAASVIARDLFLRSLADMRKEYETEVPKGASAAVREAGVEIVRKRGAKILLEVAKCHFKTTDAVLEGAGESRAALGPEGQAVSQTKQFRPRRKTSERKSGASKKAD